MMLCETCYTQVMNEKLPDQKNFVADSEALFDTIFVGCTDINGALIADMAGSGGVATPVITHLLIEYVSNEC